MARFDPELRLLRPPDRGCGEILVYAGLEKNIGGLQGGACTPKLHVEAAEWRAAVAADIAGRALADAGVARRLHQRQAHDRLRAGDQDPVLGKIVFVIEGEGLETHSVLPAAPPAASGHRC